MRNVIFIAIFLLVAFGFDFNSFATSSVPQPIQQEYNAKAPSPETIFEVGRFTVPPGKMLVIELITASAQDDSASFPVSVYPVSVTTTAGGTTVEHVAGSVLGGITGGGVYARRAFGSFSLIIYADPNTDVIFTSVGMPLSQATINVTFSGRLIDVS